MAEPATFLTQSSLKQLAKDAALHSECFKDFVEGLVHQNKKDWFDSHQHLASDVVSLVVKHKSDLDSGLVRRVTLVFLTHQWLNGLNECSVALIGTTLPIVMGFHVNTRNIFTYYLKEGKLPEVIAKNDIPFIIVLGKTLVNTHFLELLEEYVSNLLIKNEDGFELLAIFKNVQTETRILQKYFSSKKIDTFFAEQGEWFFPFSGLGILRQSKGYSVCLRYLENLYLDEKAEPAEVGSFSLAEPKLKGQIKRIQVDGYLDSSTPVLKHLYNLEESRFINIKPSLEILRALFSICLRLKKIEFVASEVQEFKEELVVSSSMYKYLQALQVNFRFKEILTRSISNA